jgi:5'-deoxynucleotidase YfbR-like HD superfamily hydrolase
MPIEQKDTSCSTATQYFIQRYREQKAVLLRLLNLPNFKDVSVEKIISNHEIDLNDLPAIVQGEIAQHSVWSEHTAHISITLALLGQVERWRKQEAIDDFKETNRGHVIGMLNLAVMAYRLCPEMFKPEEWHEIYELIIIHDLGEVFGGDVGRNEEIYAEIEKQRHKRETVGVRMLLEGQPDFLQKLTTELYEKYEHREGRHDLVSMFVKFLDSLQGAQVACLHFDKLRRCDINNPERGNTNCRGRNVVEITLCPLIKNANNVYVLLSPEFRPLIVEMLKDQLQQYRCANFEEQVEIAIQKSSQFEISQVLANADWVPPSPCSFCQNHFQQAA